MFIRVIVGLAAFICLVACDSNAVAPTESANVVGPSSVSSPRNVVPSGPAARAAGSAEVIVSVHDNCDPETFNAAIGPGACVGSGGLQFDNFIAQLTKLGFVGPWHFAPNLVKAREGEFVVINRGGETHTFTEVEEFGGGIVPDLNELAGVPNVAPECLALQASDFIAPGQTFHEDIEEDEEENYQCCIHPWMRLTTKVTGN